MLVFVYFIILFLNLFLQTGCLMYMYIWYIREPFNIPGLTYFHILGIIVIIHLFKHEFSFNNEIKEIDDVISQGIMVIFYYTLMFLIGYVFHFFV